MIRITNRPRRLLSVAGVLAAGACVVGIASIGVGGATAASEVVDPPSSFASSFGVLRSPGNSLSIKGTQALDYLNIGRENKIDASAVKEVRTAAGGVLVFEDDTRLCVGIDVDGSGGLSGSCVPADHANEGSLVTAVSPKSEGKGPENRWHVAGVVPNGTASVSFTDRDGNVSRAAVVANVFRLDLNGPPTTRKTATVAGEVSVQKLSYDETERKSHGS